MQRLAATLLRVLTVQQSEGEGSSPAASTYPVLAMRDVLQCEGRVPPPAREGAIAYQ